MDRCFSSIYYIKEHVLPLLEGKKMLGIEHPAIYVSDARAVLVILLGIEPKTIDFSMPMSREIEEAAISVADTLYKVLSE